MNLINKCKQQLHQSDDKILSLLFESDGNILDDEALVDGLNETKEAIMAINTRLTEHEETRINLTTLREKYRPLAMRASVIFLDLLLLTKLKMNYQFNLEYFASILRGIIEMKWQTNDLEERISFLMNQIVRALYESVASTLFRHDRMVFKFILALTIEKSVGNVDDKDVAHLINDTGSFDGENNMSSVVHYLERLRRMLACQPSFEKLQSLTIDDFVSAIKMVKFLSINGVDLVRMYSSNTQIRSGCSAYCHNYRYLIQMQMFAKAAQSNGSIQ